MIAVEQVPVLVVGGGPAGLASALFLRRHGVPVLLVERRARTSPLPRATGVHARTMELFREAGVEEAVRRVGLELVTTEQAAVEIGASRAISRVILRAPSLAELDQAQVLEVGEPFSRDLSPCEPVWCGQDLLEPVLATAARRAGADLRFGHELVDLEQRADGVRALVRARGDGVNGQSPGEPLEVTADYVIAADGVYSELRERLGIARDGLGVLNYMISVQITADLGSVIGGRRFILAFINNRDFAGVAVCLDGKDRWMFWTAVPDDAARARFTPERCVQLARAAIGRPDIDVRIDGIFPWETTHLVAQTYRRGRVFLVGDAAHAHPPHGGFGANAGIQDSHNLAWKLAAVTHGWADQGLLDSYNAERRPIGRATADQAIIRERHRAEAAADPDFRDFPIVILGYRYRSAAIVPELGDRSAATAALLPQDALPRRLDLTGRPGTRVPHLWLGHDGARRSTLDLCGSGLVLITGPDAELAEPASRLVAQRGLPLRTYRVGTDLNDPDGRLTTVTGIGRDGALLLRPDGFVAWRATAATGATTAELERALVAVTGRTVAMAGRSGGR